MPNRKVSEGGSARFTVTLPKHVTAELRDLAAGRGQKLAAVMREAAYFFLKHHGAQPRSKAS